MKKNMLVALSLLFAFAIKAQNTGDPVFTSVSVTNGKVVFQQFIHTDNSQSEDQRYGMLSKWGKNKYTGNPLLLGIRFDDKARSMTVSSKAELILSPNKAGVREKVLMNYRFDASIASMGCMLIVRDITYQNINGGKSSAEDVISDAAIASQGDMRELYVNTRTATLDFLNELYKSLNGIFDSK